MRVTVVVVLAFAGAAGAHAQSPDVWLREGIEAYQRLEIGNATAFLRNALAAQPPAGLTGGDHADALSYLAAAEFLRDSRDSATSAFRQLVLAHPRFRLDPLTFPQPVLNLFDTIRRATKVVELSASDSAEVRIGHESYIVRAYASSSHDVVAMIEGLDGNVVDSLYRGPIGDDRVLRWDGLTAAGTPVPTGDYLLRVLSLDPSGGELRLAQVPLDVELIRRDTLPVPPAVPPDSLLLPEALGAGPALAAFGTGAAVGLAAALLPSIVGADDPAGSRFVITGAVGLGGLLGFITRRPGRPLPHNAAVNRPLRQQWSREHELAVSENRVLSADVRLRILSGTPERIDRERR
jgi:hypothetical protein